MLAQINYRMLEFEVPTIMLDDRPILVLKVHHIRRLFLQRYQLHLSLVVVDLFVDVVGLHLVELLESLGQR